MKRLLLFISILFIVVFMSACGNSNSIVGTWEYENDSNTYYKFEKGGNGSYTYSGDTKNFVYEDRGTKVIITYEGNSSSSEFDYSISDGTLTIKDSFGNNVIYKRK